jgi:2-C-methyl-D-erythritol 4-phosphate cytidylyltransferase
VNAAIIVAGGTGERSGLSSGKQLALVAGRPVLTHTLEAFAACEAVHEIVVVVHPDRLAEYAELAVKPLRSPKVASVVAGGDTRQESVANGLAAVSPDAAAVAIHDGARPLVTSALIASAIEALESEPDLAGVVVGHPSYDTLKSVDGSRRVTGTLDRSAVWAAQTPQVFRAAVLIEAFERAAEDGYVGTDDASLVERIGGAVAVIPGPRDNIKITVPEDLLIVERLLALRGEGESGE